MKVAREAATKSVAAADLARGTCPSPGDSGVAGSSPLVADRRR